MSVPLGIRALRNRRDDASCLRGGERRNHPHRALAPGTHERISFVDFADQPRPGEGRGPVFPPGASRACGRGARPKTDREAAPLAALRLGLAARAAGRGAAARQRTGAGARLGAGARPPRLRRSRPACARRRRHGACTRVPLVALTAGPPCHLAGASIRPRQWPRRWSVDASRSPGNLSSAQAARKPAVAVRAPAPAGAARASAARGAATTCCSPSPARRATSAPAATRSASSPGVTGSSSSCCGPWRTGSTSSPCRS